MIVVLASHNRKKLGELAALLTPIGWDLRLVSEFSAIEPDETAPTFVENALIKARHAASVSGYPAIADDSGLEVRALVGAPGVLSARYAGTHGDDLANNGKLLADLGSLDPAQRGARFVSVLALLRSAADPVPLIAQGFWEGRILTSPRGSGGFGYDPLFFLDEHGCTAAELPPAIKNTVSHRARALGRLVETLKTQPWP